MIHNPTVPPDKRTKTMKTDNEKMQALKAAYLATGTVKNVAVIASKTSKSSKSPPSQNPGPNPEILKQIESDRYRIMVQRTLSTLNLLQVMLKRILESKNENLINDINEMGIITKLENIENWFNENGNRQFNTLTVIEKAKLSQIIQATDILHDQLKSLIMVNPPAAIAPMHF